ncbi:MAG: hypothetical protein ABEL04_00540 [Salinibacter sp.]|uniref:hypothetical protein n=1 Tax=Salinibacter sp. TaxID=2065818 RepID=UPI0035D41168
METPDGIDIPARVPYRTTVMNTRTPTSALLSAFDAHVGATGGLCAFARFALGYAYLYFYVFLPTAGGA